MYRGTTPVVTLKLNIDISLIEEIYITFAQNKNNVLEKTLADCTLGDKKVSVQLTQVETLEFKPFVKLYIQGRVKLTDGTILATPQEFVKVEDILKDGEI